jgi:formate dehydrogenase subunit gamma
MTASRVISPREPAGTVHPEGIITRYTLNERLNHWFAALTYIYCLVTGLAFWSPYMFWLATIVGGGPTARFWHPWFGLAFTVSVFLMYDMWHRDMRTTEADKQWSKDVKYYIENEDEKLPPIGRFNHGQKIFFWLMFYGIILLLISGIGLWFVESIPWSLRWLRYLAVTIHVAAAMATIGGFIIHVYMGTAMVRGGFTSIIRGEVSTEWARTHHRLWYEQVTGDKSEPGRRNP